MQEPLTQTSLATRYLTLPSGEKAVIRPIGTQDSHLLTEALDHLSPESRYQRFFFPKHCFTQGELNQLTHSDGIVHLALGMATLDEQNNEKEPLAVARCVRDTPTQTEAQIAIVVADQWHGQGLGTIMLEDMSVRALSVGITHWRAHYLSRNEAVRQLLQKVALRLSESSEGDGILSGLFELTHPVKLDAEQTQRSET